MEPLTPLAAFQGLAIAIAAAVVIDARKEPTPWRYILFGVAALFGLVGVFASWIGGVWPASLRAMGDLGGNPVVWFVAMVGFYFVARPYWKSTGKAAHEPVVPAAEVLSEKVSEQIDEALEAVRRFVVSTRDELREELAHEAREREAVKNSLHRRIEAAEKITQPLKKEQQRKLKEEFVAMVKAERLPKPDPRVEGAPPRPPQYAPTGVGPRMRESRKAQMLIELGVPNLDNQPEVKAARDDIIKDAAYCQLENDDHLYWDDWRQKRAWYAHNAAVDAKLKWLRNNGFRTD